MIRDGSNAEKFKMKNDIHKILRNTEETLRTAEHGLVMIDNEDPTFRLTGLRNVVVFGRAVTNAIQKLRSKHPEFEKWYQPWVDRMKEDGIIRYFYELRSEILKEGKLPTHISFSGSRINPSNLMKSIPRPPGAKRFFFGDRLGGSGWVVETGDGQEEKFYVNISENTPGIDKLKVSIHLTEAPNGFENKSINELASYYIDFLKEIIADAKAVFTEKQQA